MPLTKNKYRAGRADYDNTLSDTIKELEKKYRLRELDYKMDLLREQYRENSRAIKGLEAKIRYELDRLEVIKLEKEVLLKGRALSKECYNGNASRLHPCLEDYAKAVIKHFDTITDYFVDGDSVHLEIISPDGLYNSVITFINKSGYKFSSPKVHDKVTSKIAREIQTLMRDDPWA